MGCTASRSQSATSSRPRGELRGEVVREAFLEEALDPGVGCHACRMRLLLVASTLTLRCCSTRGELLGDTGRGEPKPPAAPEEEGPCASETLGAGSVAEAEAPMCASEALGAGSVAEEEAPMCASEALGAGSVAEAEAPQLGCCPRWGGRRSDRRPGPSLSEDRSDRSV